MVKVIQQSSKQFTHYAEVLERILVIIIYETEITIIIPIFP